LKFLKICCTIVEKSRGQLMINAYIYDTDLGKIVIADNGNEITNIELACEINVDDINIRETDLIREASRQLMEYLSSNRKSFDLPLNPHGTEFQKRVWKALRNIPYGETRSYNPLASRAVGMANNKNPIMIIVPCHRVIGSNGTLVGYAGGLDMKKKLLDLERSKSL
jgi:methylated-DNA-[protein]-cysteine S-methyltransferase